MFLERWVDSEPAADSKEDRSFNEKKTIFSGFCVDFSPSANKIAGIISQARGFLYEVIIPISPD